MTNTPLEKVKYR